MTDACSEARFVWHIFDVGYSRGYDSCSPELMVELKDKPRLKSIHDKVVESADDPNSLVHQMLKAVKNGPKINIFLYDNAPAGHPIATPEYFPLFGGIHLDWHGVNVMVNNPIRSKTFSEFTHELWHIVLQRLFPPKDITDLFRLRDQEAYTNPKLREQAFEEGFAEALRFAELKQMNPQYEIKYLSDGSFSFELNGKKFKDLMGRSSFAGASNVFIGALNCLSEMAETHPLMPLFMMNTVKKNGGFITLEDFVSYFIKEYPEIANKVMPKACRPERCLFHEARPEITR